MAISTSKQTIIYYDFSARKLGYDYPIPSYGRAVRGGVPPALAGPARRERCGGRPGEPLPPGPAEDVRPGAPAAPEPGAPETAAGRARSLDRAQPAAVPDPLPLLRRRGGGPAAARELLLRGLRVLIPLRGCVLTIRVSGTAKKKINKTGVW